MTLHRAGRSHGLPSADRAQDLAVLAHNRLAVDSVADLLDQRRLEDVQRPAGERAQQLVPGSRGDRPVEARVGEAERIRRWMLPLLFRDCCIELEHGLDGRVTGREPGERNLELDARLDDSPSETLWVSSLVEFDSLRLRLMPSFGVLATKIPPRGPRDARIR
jgi:hypothetical protein